MGRNRADRDATLYAEAMSRPERASRDPRDNTMPHFIAAVNVGATVGEVCNLWRKVYGEYKERVVG